MMRAFKTTTTCAICTTEFVRKNSRSRYCSTDCSREGERRTSNDYHANYRRTNPDPPLHKQARKAVELALKHNAFFDKPDACVKCRRKTSELHAHHHAGYDPEHWLDVTWLCKACHAETHRIAA